MDNILRSLDVPNTTVQWTLWRIGLKAKNTYLVVNGVRVPIKNVITLLEMPAYYFEEPDKHGWPLESVYWEVVYWDVVGHPALALAVHLASPLNEDPG